MDQDRPAAWVIGVGVTILTISGLLIAVMASCSRFNLAFGPAPRKHLQQIRIDKRACPYVVAMHSTANAFQSAEPLADFYFGPGQALIAPPWPRVRTRVQRSLLDLQLAILVGRPHFPAAIRHQLNVTLDSIHTGLRELPRARSADDLTTRSSDALAKGQTAFGYAGDLVGTQCEVKLGADSPLASPTSQDLADYACKQAIGRGKFLNAAPTTVGRLRALAQGGFSIDRQAFRGADNSARAAYCWKRLEYEYVSYAADLGGHATVVATLGWKPRMCKRTEARPRVCIPPIPTPPPGPPRAGR